MSEFSTFDNWTVPNEYDAYDFQNVPPSSESVGFPETQTSDMSFEPQGYGWEGTSAQPEVSQIPRSDSGIDLSGILKPITSTAESFLNVWGKVAQISTSAATQKAAQEIDRAKLDLVKAQTLGQIDVAKANVARDGRVAEIQAQTQVAKESQILASTKGGTFTASAASNWPVLLGLGVTLWVAFRKKK